MNQLGLHFAVETSYCDEDFLISDCNSHAWESVKGWSNAEEASVFLLRGSAASGKTHLATLWARQQGAALIDASAMQLSDSPEALFSRSDALVIEDCELSQQPETLFHLLNYAKQQAVKCLLTAEDESCWAGFTLPDLRSRLQALPQAIIYPPDDSILAALLVKNFKDRQLQVSQEVVDYLLKRMGRSYISVPLLVEALDKRAIEQKKPITIALARGLLTEY